MNEEEKNVLHIMIQKMDIPLERKNIYNTDNLKWLKNNLGIKNSEHRYFDQSMRLIELLLNENK